MGDRARQRNILIDLHISVWVQVQTGVQTPSIDKTLWMCDPTRSNPEKAFIQKINNNYNNNYLNYFPEYLCSLKA